MQSRSQKIFPDLGISGNSSDALYLLPHFIEVSHRPEDQAKVRLAVGLGRVDPADVPASAKISSASSPNKRKLPASATQIHSAGSSSLGQVEINDDDASSEGTVDELYCTLETTVVGIQYYHGWSFLFCRAFTVHLKYKCCLHLTSKRNIESASLPPDLLLCGC